MNLADRLRRGLGRRLLDQRVDAGGLQLNDLRVDGWVGNFIGGLRNDQSRLRAESRAQTLEIILPEIVVLVENADLCLRLGFEDVFGDDAAFGLEVGIERNGPGKLIGIVEAASSRRDEELRHLLGIEIFLDGDVRRGPYRTDLGKDADILDELSGLLDGFRRTVGVVELSEADLASIDPAPLIEHVEVAEHCPSSPRAKRGRRAAERRRLTELDLGVAGSGIISVLGKRGREGQESGCEYRARCQDRCAAQGRSSTSVFLDLAAIEAVRARSRGAGSGSFPRRSGSAWRHASSARPDNPWCSHSRRRPARRRSSPSSPCRC